MKTYKHKNNGSTMTYKDGCMRIENLVVEGHPNLEFWEEVIENNNPLNLVLGKTYKIRYKFCMSSIKICKVDRFTQNGYPWSNSLGGAITDSYELIEEVVEKDYEILSFKKQNSSHLFTLQENGNYFLENDYRFDPNGYFCGLPESYHLDIVNSDYEIYSVKRISDGQIFTVGDECNPIGEYSNNRGTIDKIEFCEAGYLRLASKNWYMNIDGIEHSRKPFGKDYEILSVKSIPLGSTWKCVKNSTFGISYEGDVFYCNGGAIRGFEILEGLNKGRYSICSVKRLSDGEIFTIGDKCKEGFITKIIVKNDKIYLEV